MKKMIIALLVLVSFVLTGCVGLDCMTKNYATVLRDQTAKSVLSIGTINDVHVFEVDRENPLEYSYRVKYRIAYMNEYNEIGDSVNVIDMIKSYY